MTGRAHIDHPFRFDANGRTAVTSTPEHIQDLVEVTLLTSPGERVNRPEFGAGLAALIFEPNSRTLADSAEFFVRTNLERWLRDIIEIESLSVVSEDAILTVNLAYTINGTGERIEQSVVRR